MAEAAGDRLNRELHSGRSLSLRGRLANAALVANGRLPDYKSPVAEGMYRKRFPNGVVNDTTAKEGPRAGRGQGRVYVPSTPTGDSFNDSYGYWGMANHESEHAYNQSATDPLTARYREIAPTVGDLVFFGQQVQNETGKPLDHQVDLPGMSHKITWMQEQARKHGYFDGQSMQKLLFDTPEGRQWMRKASGRDWVEAKQEQAHPIPDIGPQSTGISRTPSNGSSIQAPEGYIARAYSQGLLQPSSVESVPVQPYVAQAIPRSFVSSPPSSSVVQSVSNGDMVQQAQYPKLDKRTGASRTNGTPIGPPTLASEYRGSVGGPLLSARAVQPDVASPGIASIARADTSVAPVVGSRPVNSVQLSQAYQMPVPAQQVSRSPEQIVAAFNQRFGISPARQAQASADTEMDRALAAKNAADLQGNLGFTGARLNGDYVRSLNRQADLLQQDRASMDAMNDHLSAGGGLQYRQGSTGFGTPEQGAQAAASFRAMSAMDSARKAEFDARWNSDMDKFRAQRAANDASVPGKQLNLPPQDLDGDGIPDVGVSETFGKYGIKNMTDLSTVNAKYNAYMRQFRQESPSGQRAMSFDEFVKAQHDRYQSLPAYNPDVIKPKQDERKGPSPLRVQMAQDQARLNAAAAYARANGLDPRAAIMAQSQVNNRASLENMLYDSSVGKIREQGAVDLDIAKQRGSDALAVAETNGGSELAVAKQRGMDALALGAQSGGQSMVLEGMKQRSLADQRAADMRIKNAELVSNTLGNMANPQEVHDATIASVMANPAMASLPPDQLAKVAQARADQAVASAIEKNKIQAKLAEGFGVDGKGVFDSYLDSKSLVPYVDPKTGQVNQGHAAAPAPAVSQGPARAQHYVDAMRDAQSRGIPMDGKAIQDILLGRGLYTDSATVNDLVALARSNESGNDAANVILKSLLNDVLYGADVTSWTDYTIPAYFSRGDWLNDPWVNPEYYVDGRFDPSKALKSSNEKRVGEFFSSVPKNKLRDWIDQAKQ